MTDNDIEDVKRYIVDSARLCAREMKEVGLPPHTAALILFVAHHSCEQQALSDFGDDADAVAEYQLFKKFFVDKCAEFARLKAEGVDVAELLKNGLRS